MAAFNSKTFFQAAAKSDVIKIIVSISLMYVILHFIRISILIGGDDVSFFFKHIWNKLGLPTEMKQFLKQPWSLFSYMWCDMSFMQIVGNMIWLWVFGTVIEDLKGAYRIIPIFITGGILGGIFYLVSSYFLPGLVGYYAGSIASVAAVALAAILYNPNYSFWLLGRYNVPIWVFGVVFFLLQFLAIGRFSWPMLGLLLGGLLAGLGYKYLLVNYYEAFTSRLKKMDSFFWNNDNFVVKKRNDSFNQIGSLKSYRVVNINEKKLNILLDKINEKGIDSLTKEEKKQLEDYSKTQ